MEIYEYEDYKEYLRMRLTDIKKTSFSDAIGCQPSFLSQVLNGNPHLSLEQGVRANHALKHASAEADFFIDLLQLGRAGSSDLSDFFRQRLNKARREFKKVSKQIQSNTEISPELRNVYYSRFVYSAVQMLIGIYQKNQIEKLSEVLRMEEAEVSAALQFLSSMGLVEKQADRWLPIDKRMHVAADSPDIIPHHRNFRLESLRRLENSSPSDLFYSGVFALSKGDLEKVRGLILKLIKDKEKILGPSKEETAFVMNIDFFALA